MKRFGLVLLVFIFAISLGGCASMQEWCGPQKMAAATPAPAQVVAQAPPKAPEPVKPPPPPKKDRN